MPKISNEKEINNNSNLDLEINQSKRESKEDEHQFNNSKFEELENLINQQEGELNFHKDEGTSVFNQLNGNYL